MNFLQDLLSSSGVRVEGLMGSHIIPGGFKGVDIAICTIEKANSLINRLSVLNNIVRRYTVNLCCYVRLLLYLNILAPKLYI
jgi:hypothetical protein